MIRVAVGIVSVFSAVQYGTPVGAADPAQRYYEFEGKRYPREVKTGKAGIEMVCIEPGEFVMGIPEREEGRKGDEGPQRRVRITRPFYMGRYEVTRSQYAEVMGRIPGLAAVASSPVEGVSWSDAREFSRRVGCRLPTEAEWEYACRAGTVTPFWFGETVSTDQANYNGAFAHGAGGKGVYRRRAVAVGSFPANGWGLYDMHGNVWEWCGDWYGKEYYRGRPDPDADPEGPSSGSHRVLRGGSWLNHPRYLRSALRNGYYPSHSHIGIGFRVARTLHE